jgi:histone deacetylase 11
MNQPRILYSPKYDMSLWGIERLHPFDSRKASRAWRLIRAAMGSQADALRALPVSPADSHLLESVHSQAYLNQLESSGTIADALEMRWLRFLPAALLDNRILLPMRWATQGTVNACEMALINGCAVNLGGGYHHAHRDRGEGFCVYADIPIAIEHLRQAGLLQSGDKIAVIDLDAHRGNGFESIYEHDSNVHFFDIYNFQVYPGLHKQHVGSHNVLCGLRSGIGDDGYMNVLKSELPKFLGQAHYRLAFYNAGTDVFRGDPLGRLNLSHDAVLERDRYVLSSLDGTDIPWVVTPSGGYTKESHRLLADTVIWACGSRT